MKQLKKNWGFILPPAKVHLFFMLLSLSFVSCGRAGFYLADAPCDHVDCSGHGSCAVHDGLAQCACDWGYHNANADDGSISCIVDEPYAACDDVDCGLYGNCTVYDDSAYCQCETGWHADGLSCVVDIDPMAPCDEVDCGLHGSCTVYEDSAFCQCETGWHADGLSCIVDDDPMSPCDAVDCSGRGDCAVQEGLAVCVCQSGYHDDGAQHCVADEFPCEGADGDPCDDGLFCTVGETCLAGRCQGGHARDCDDANACSVDRCDDNLDACVDDGIPAGLLPEGEGSTCSNNIDDDCDGDIDADDSGCWDLSNVPRSLWLNLDTTSLSALDLSGAQSPVVINSDDGSIVDASGTQIRSAGLGLVDGIDFQVVPQVSDPSLLASVFSAASLSVPEGMTVSGTGQHAIIFLLQHDAEIHGLIDVGARRAADAEIWDGDTIPGPGGYAGGAQEQPGQGPGAGQIGARIVLAGYGAPGGGGGGHAGLGGDGGTGARSSSITFAGGVGGMAYGTQNLSPLQGGSGGAGGLRELGSLETLQAATGGAGGGALQISARGLVHVYAGGGIIAPGGGGSGAAVQGGGGGAGAGGSILIEASLVLTEPGAFLSANGGGGGSGDCN